MEFNESENLCEINFSFNEEEKDHLEKLLKEISELNKQNIENKNKKNEVRFFINTFEDKFLIDFKQKFQKEFKEQLQNLKKDFDKNLINTTNEIKNISTENYELRHSLFKMLESSKSLKLRIEKNEKEINGDIF